MSRSIISSLAFVLVLAVALPAAPPPVLPKLDPEEMKDAKKAAAAALKLEEAYPGKKRPEAIKMLVAILRGSQMNSGEGWFGPAASRYSFKWLAEACKVDDAKKGISRKDFPGDDLDFSRLDRNGDGRIAASDLDWSDNNPFVQQYYMVGRLFRRMNPRGDGQLSKDDLEKFFEKAAKGKDHLTTDDLREAWLSGGGGFNPGDAPSTTTLIKGLYAGEVGSIHEGPNVGDLAPDFELATPDGKKKIQLKSLLGKKPVVLVLGNFTCGPFRSMYSEVENVIGRYRDRAEFLMVYVREAHPSDGWAMESNAKVGVAVTQPKSNDERAKVCQQFQTKLKPTIPVVVDGVDDRVGHAYSGMPARLYVIDPSGKVTYKGGRGPFGFRAGEMEQALAMTFLESATAEPKPTEKK